jgi:hypothetical protein
MPKLHDDTFPADIWFEEGVIYYEDPQNPERCSSQTLERFKNYINGILVPYAEDEEILKQFVCGRQALLRFIREARELIRESEAQLHVGLPLEVIAKEERSRAAVSRRQGLGLGLLAVPSGRFTQKASGLIVPSF